MDSRVTLRSIGMSHVPFVGVALSLLLSAGNLVAQSDLFDIAPFSRPCSGGDQYVIPTVFDYSLKNDGKPQFERVANRYVCAVQWEEERDVQEVNLHFASAYTGGELRLEYWCHDWPYQPPAMPAIEDPVDDPWQGHWIPAEIKSEVVGLDCRLTFKPLNSKENKNADNLPNLLYRRTLKVRLVAESQPPALEQLKVFSGSVQTNVTVRIELGTKGVFSTKCDGRLTAYNGAVQNVRGWRTSSDDHIDGTGFHFTTNSSGGRKGLVFDVKGCQPILKGSHDVTLVTFRSEDCTFTFALPDVQKGPMYLPDFDAIITLDSTPSVDSDSFVKQGQRIRERLAREPEQTYERASREIPALDPVERQNGRLYLPLTIDSSWQKFAFSWGGSVFISKFHSKAKQPEIKRMEWKGDDIQWRIGTGTEPNFRPDASDTKMSILEDCLPVVTAVWTNGSIEYREEAFATSLSGPLGWKERDEQSPVVLMLKLTARNMSPKTETSHVWLGITPSETLKFDKGELLTADQLVRARVTPGAQSKVSPAEFKEDETQLHGLHLESNLAPSAQESAYIVLPFIPRLTDAQRELLAKLDYSQERTRVIDYWRTIADNSTHFDIPEKRFVSFGRSMVVHIHLSTTKDPKSGLFMVPAASYDYQVYANESCFQVLTLDALGDHQTATDYLETFIQLQGSRPFRSISGNQGAVYHGAKVSDEYDYTASDYNLDHGTVLWTFAEHYFMTRDRQWLEHALPGMIRAADWIIDERGHTKVQDKGQPVPEYGLLPAGNLEDNPDWAHWFAINAYASIGMTRLADVLADIQHPEAGRISQAAKDYRADLRRAIFRATQEAPVTRLRDNTYVPYVPVRPHQHFRHFGPLRVEYYNRYPNPVPTNYRLSSTREVLYGPLIFLNLDIFEGKEPISGWILDDWEDNLTMSTSFGLNVHGWVDDDMWFSQGGMVFQANLQNPVLAYLRRGEVPAAIRNLYNDFVSCLYPDVNAFTEEYHAWKAGSGPFYKIPDEARFVSRVRDLLVHEQGNELWLTFGTPRRWLSPGKRIQLTDMPTLFGPVSLDLKAAESEIDGEIKLPTRYPASKAWLVLRVPENQKIGSVAINGQTWTQLDLKREAIQLPSNSSGTLRISVKLIPR